MLPQPPEGSDPPPEIHSFHRAGPALLIPGSLCLVLLAAWLSEALRWSDPIRGFQFAGFMLLFLLPGVILLMVVQIVLAAVFMSQHRRAWWRTWLVLSPAALVVAAALASVASLYPPERRATRELGRLLGGPVPASVEQVRLTFEGGMDPSWRFVFRLSPGDLEAIRSYRNYRSGAPMEAHVPPNFYRLTYDPTAGLCVFEVLNY